MSTPEHVFHQLSHIFSTRRDRILEFEILPAGIGPLLQDGCSIGISKEALVQCFVIARQIFFETASKCDKNPEPPSTPPAQPVDGNTLSISSQIILLFDCEHLTACNWRKRLLLSTIRSHDFSTAGHGEHESLVQLLESELTLMASYLTSPLHRHTKSPTLWQHRLWVMSHVLRVQGLEPTDRIMARATPAYYRPRPARPGLETVRELFVVELDVVLRAGELHPRNYYAFSYARELHRVLATVVGVEGGFEVLARSVITQFLDWCLAHPRDISGWMFALDLLEAIQDGSDRVESIKRVVRFALDVGWDGESLWTFVDLGTRRFGIVETVQDMLQSHPGATPDSAMSRLSIDGTAMPEKPWKTWVARVRAYWAAGGL